MPEVTGAGAGEHGATAEVGQRPRLDFFTVPPLNVEDTEAGKLFDWWVRVDSEGCFTSGDKDPSKEMEENLL